MHKTSQETSLMEDVFKPSGEVFYTCFEILHCIFNHVLSVIRCESLSSHSLPAFNYIIEMKIISVSWSSCIPFTCKVSSLTSDLHKNLPEVKFYLILIFTCLSHVSFGHSWCSCFHLTRWVPVLLVLHLAHTLIFKPLKLPFLDFSLHFRNIISHNREIYVWLSSSLIWIR